jgi:hypothetical protein
LGHFTHIPLGILFFLGDEVGSLGTLTKEVSVVAWFGGVTAGAALSDPNQDFLKNEKSIISIAGATEHSFQKSNQCGFKKHLPKSHLEVIFLNVFYRKVQGAKAAFPLDLA